MLKKNITKPHNHERMLRKEGKENIPPKPIIKTALTTSLHRMRILRSLVQNRANNLIIMAYKVLRVISDWGFLAELEPWPLSKWIVGGSILVILSDGGGTHAGSCEGTEQGRDDQ